MTKFYIFEWKFRQENNFYQIKLNKFAHFDITLHHNATFRQSQGLDYAIQMEAIKTIILPKYPTFKGIDNFFTSQISIKGDIMFFSYFFTSFN